MKKLKKVLPIVLVAGLVILVVVVVKSRNGVTEVQVAKAEIRNVAKTVSASGETAVTEDYTKRALVSGTIKEVKVKSGDLVKKDELVLELDQASVKAGLDTAYTTYLSAKADLDSYEQSLAAAQASLSSKEKDRDVAWRAYMADNGDGVKQSFKTAEAAYQTALSTYTTLKDSKTALTNATYSTYSTYFSALTNYRNTTITAPADGRLALAEGINQGSLVTAGQALFSIASTNTVIFKAEIDEADISQIKVGMKANVSLDSYPGKFFSASVDTIDAKVETLASGSTVVMADVSFANAEVLPIVGLSGSVDIEFDKTEHSISVLPEAIVEDLERKYVFVVVDGKAYRREVTTGLEGDEYTVITSGVNEADLVVTNAADLKLVDAQKVRI